LGGWFRVEDEGWERDIVHLPKPWPRSFVLADLRYWENRVRSGRTAFPTRSELVARWGWTDRGIRTLLGHDDWHDPQNPVPAEDLFRSRAPFRQTDPKATKDRPEGDPKATRENGPDSEPSELKRPEGDPKATKDRPETVHARDLLNQEPEPRTFLAPSAPPAPKGKRAKAPPSKAYPLAIECWTVEHRAAFGADYPWVFKGRDADGSRVKAWLAAACVSEDGPAAGLDRLATAIRAYFAAVRAREAWPRGDPATTKAFSRDLAKWLRTSPDDVRGGDRVAEILKLEF
jgi:hypothetical protein